MSAANGSDGPRERMKATAAGRVTPKRIEELAERQNYRCAITGVELTPETAALDHIVSRRSGGQHTMANVQVLHKEVNRMKGTLSPAEFVKWCRRVANGLHG